MRKLAILAAIIVMGVVFYFQMGAVLGACSGTDTYTLNIFDPNKVKLRSVSSSITPTGGIDCNSATSNAVNLSANCQMSGTYIANATCASCTVMSGVNDTGILTCYASESKKVLLKNVTGSTIAAFDSKGYLYLRGFNASQQGTLDPPRNSYIVRNNTGAVVAYIASNGSIYLRGSISLSQSSLAPPKNSFIVRNYTGADVAYIDSSGNLKLTGKLYYNWTDPI